MANEGAIIFLDIDGVLIPSRNLAQRKPALTCVRNLNILAGATGAVVVVSSTWRNAGLGRTTFLLQSWGVAAPIVGLTPELASQKNGIWQAKPRGREIQEWLAHNPHETFVI